MSDSLVACITGATSGIGRAFAEAYAKLGYDLILIGRRQALLEKNAQFFEEHYHVFCQCLFLDLASADAIDTLSEKLRSTTVDVLINNAGFGLKGTFPRQSPEDTAKMLSLHVLCVTRLTQAVLPQMLSRNSGTLINVASDAAYVIVPGNALYSGTKAFIKQFTEGLYLDLRAQGSAVRVQALCPCLTKTDFQLKMGMSRDKQVNRGIMRWEDPQQVVAHSFHALAHDQPVCICGGWTGTVENLLTRLLPKRLYYPLMLKMFPLK